MAGKQAGWGCLVVFGLVFALAGSIPGLLAVRDVVQAGRMTSWPQTEATLVKVELTGRKTPSVSCTYRYRTPDPTSVEGGTVERTGSTVGVHSGSDNIGSWQQDTYQRLDVALRAGRTVPCWYDPADPDRAVLDREVRWGLVGFMCLFPLLFGGIGCGLVVAGFRSRRRRPDQPSRPASRSAGTDARIIRPGTAAAVWWPLGIAAFWNAIAWAGMLGALSSQGSNRPPDAVLLLIALFPLIGLLLAWWAGLQLLRRIRHGVPELRLREPGLRTGSRIEAAVHLRHQPEPGDRVDAVLAVVRIVTTGSGKNQSRSEHTEWSLALPADPAAGVAAEDGGWLIPLRLPLPADQPPWDPDGSLDWRLTWRLIRPGLDIDLTFALPVEAGPGNAPELLSADLAREADHADPLGVLRRAGITVAEEDGALVVDLPAGRNAGLYVVGLIFALALAGAVAALWLLGHQVWSILAAPVALLALRGALRSALYRSRIRVRGGRAAVVAGWWRMSAEDDFAVATVDSTTSLSAGEVSYHNLHLVLHDGRRIACARGVPGPAAAARLVQLLQAALARTA